VGLPPVLWKGFGLMHWRPRDKVPAVKWPLRPLIWIGTAVMMWTALWLAAPLIVVAIAAFKGLR
jgi:hypothetical protein